MEVKGILWEPYKSLNFIIRKTHPSKSPILRVFWTFQLLSWNNLGVTAGLLLIFAVIEDSLTGSY